jgi:hypothetical protein
MTTTDEILALAAHGADQAAADQAAADLAGFARAAELGMSSDIVRALETLPDGAAWRAWRSAAAAAAGAGPHEPIARYIVCAAATAAGDDYTATAAGNYCAAAVAAGTRAAALVESGLAGGAAQAGWSVAAVAAVIGAGLAAGIMLRLPETALRHALGICATQAAGLQAAAGTDAGPLQAGKAAFNAVEAAQLARLGFTSSREPLDGRRGLFALFNR